MSFRQALVNQFKQPRGILGGLAGRIMANRPSNIARNQWTVDLLDLQADDRVLEIGFGPGIAIEAVARRVTEGQITGVDHSAVMLQQAGRRNAQAIADGRVNLYLGLLQKLPPYEEPFTKIFSVNVVQFWVEPVMEFTKLRAMLAAEGLLVSTYMPRSRNATNRQGLEKAKEIAGQLRQAGFAVVEIEELAMKPLSAYSVVASHA